MNKKELISKATEVLRLNGVKKPVSIKKHTFHITDDDGRCADFHVKRDDKTVIYTTDDTENIIDACIAVIIDALQHGESISIKGFGSLGVQYRAARRTKDFYSDNMVEIEERYIPKFNFGNDLRMAARVYQLSLEQEDREDEAVDETETTDFGGDE